MKKAIIVGSRGQDGRILYDLLQGKGYALCGVWRGGPVDVRRGEAVRGLVKRFKPDEIYYLAAHHHASQDAADGADIHRRSWEVNVLGLVNFLEAMRRHRPGARLFYASSSRVFGTPATERVNERTPLAPDDVYGVSKAAGMLACGLYRRQHGLFASVGIFFNHESSLRDPKFVSRKIVQAAVAVKRGESRPLVLGSLDDEIDWGYAPDFARAMLAILRHRRADDFIVSSGKKHSVREFVSTAFSALGLDWTRHVRVDPALLALRRRPLVGDHRKLTRLTGWRPRTSFEEMIRLMIAAEQGA